jgi:hypothetical protein
MHKGSRLIFGRENVCRGGATIPRSSLPSLGTPLASGILSVGEYTITVVTSETFFALLTVTFEVRVAVCEVV